MAEGDERTGAAQSIVTRLDEEILQALIRADELGNLNLRDPVEDLRVVRELAEALSQEDPNTLPRSLVETDLQAKDTEVEGLLNAMQTFNVEGAQPANERANLVNQAAAIKEWFLTQVKASASRAGP